jgi:hypothetical protein
MPSLKNERLDGMEHWRPNWRSFSSQRIVCKHGNKVSSFWFCPPSCPGFSPVPASHGNALLGRKESACVAISHNPSQVHNFIDTLLTISATRRSSGSCLILHSFAVGGLTNEWKFIAGRHQDKPGQRQSSEAPA